MKAGEAQKLEEYVTTTSFIMRLFIFILFGAQVDFGLMGQYLVGGIIVVAIFMSVAQAGDGLFVCVARPACTAGPSTRCCSCAGPARPV